MWLLPSLDPGPSLPDLLISRLSALNLERPPAHNNFRSTLFPSLVNTKIALSLNLPFLILLNLFL